MKPLPLRGILLLSVAMLVVVGMGLFFLQQKNSADDPIQAEAKVIQENGTTVVVLAPSLQKKVGISSQLVMTENGASLTQTAYGSVMALPDVSDLLSRMAVAEADLIRAKANFISAEAAYRKAQATRQISQAALQKVQVGLGISRKAYERLRTLNADNRNVSAKTVESAEGTYQGTQSDVLAAQAQIQSSQADLLAAQGQMMAHQADRQAAEGALKSIREAAIQRLGPVIAQWMLSGSRQFDRLLERQDVLVQITLPAQQTPPATLSLQTSDRAVLSARYVAPAIQVDPKVQGASFAYLASGVPGLLLPGMNVVATVPVKTGNSRQFFFIPASAVVWWEGSTWAYIRSQSDRFVRRRISGKQVQGHWLITDGFKPGELLVTQGAQLLLSQEFQSQYQGE